MPSAAAPVTAALAADPAAPAGGEGDLDRRDRLADRARLRREPARDRRRGDHRRLGALLLPRPRRLPHRTSPAPRTRCSTRPRTRRPSSGHLLGTDQSGFDILGRIMYGGQVSLEVGFAAAAIATIIGVLYGAISGFFGGWIDAVMMRIVDVLLSVPLLFLRDRARGDLPPVADDPDPGHRVHRVARAGAARARRDAVAARARVRAGRARDGRQQPPRSCCGTSSRTRSARSSSTRRSRSPTRSCCSPRSGSSASACRRR